MEFTQQESALLEALAMANGQDPNVIRAAEIKLKEWEIQPGYYSTLLKIILNHSIDSNVRWLAASIFKNGIDKYWRKTAPHAIQEAEKVSLRTDLMNTFGEPVNIVARQVAVVISRIARFDCPKEWPELIPNLMEVVKSTFPLVQHRGLYTLNQVIKALASKRLPGDKRQFQSIAAIIYSPILSYWNSEFENFQYCMQMRKNDPRCQEAITNFLSLLKILKKLTVHGFKVPHECSEVMEFVKSLYEKLENMFLIRKYGADLPWLSPLSEKVISHMTTVFLLFLENHPYSFVSFICPSLQFIYNFNFKEPNEALFQKFIIQSLNLMKAIIMCPEYKKIKFSDMYSENQIAVSAQANQAKTEFFKSEILEGICTKLINNYFLLNEEDLQLWEGDPEKFALDDVGESWKFCLHPCSHALYLALLHEFREDMTAISLKLLQENQLIVDPQDFKGILRKDATYTCFGLCAFDFYDLINFDEWFTSTLVHELAIKEPNYRILRRRIAWLIGKWTDVKPAVELKSAMYGAVIHLLSRDEDLVVRLTAAMALKSIVDSLKFSPDQFTNFLGPSFSMLFTLLQEVEECSTKMQVLDVLSFIVARVGEDIKPYSQSLIQYLPMLWEDSVNHNMLRCVIVSTLVQFVKALVTDNLTPFLYPVIEHCTDFSNDAHVYLLEDGLELWFTLLERSSTLTPELFYLYKNIHTILENTLEYLECCCSIIQAYIVLSPDTFLTKYGESLITLCRNLMTDINGKGIIKIMHVVETVLKASPQKGTKISLNIFVSIIINILQEEHYTMTMTMYFKIICRVILYSKEVFSQALEIAACVKNCMVEPLLEQILLVWNKAMPLVPAVEERKLLALGLSSLLTIKSKVVLSQFSPIVKNLVEALNDIMNMDCLSAELNSLMLGEDNGANDTIMERRRAQLDESDPVFLIEFKGYLQSQFNELKNQVGPNNFESLLQTLDGEILQRCRTYIII